MWQKLKEQLPTIIVTAVIIIVAAFFLHRQTVAQMDQRQQTEIAALKEQTNAQLQASAEETRRQIDAVNQLLKDAISKRQAEVFNTDEEVAKLNNDRIGALAEAIAQKMQPYNPLPKTPEEAEKMQNAQVDKVSSRLAEKIQPILSEMTHQQKLTNDQLAAYSQRITDQISGVLTDEMAKNQQLNNNVIETQAIARDALSLSHQVTALYLSSTKDQGLLTRLLTLPANVVKDAASLSIVSSSDRAKMEKQLVDQMNDLQKRLDSVQAQQPKP